MTNLNDIEGMRQLDPDGMIDRLSDFPTQIRDAWQNVSGWHVERAVAAGIHEILVLGMGGSAIGAELVAGVVSDELPVPLSVHRGYDLPAWVDEDTLVIASSYSGGTEETLSGWHQAAARGARRMAVTTGGTLAEEAEGEGAPLLTFSYESQPRAALGHSFTLLLGVLWRLGLIADPGDSVLSAAELLETSQREWQPEVPLERCWPKQIAAWWAEGLPVVFGAEHLSAIARRWTTQINENSKAWALWAEMPELNHNIVVGLEHAAQVRRAARVILLRSPHYHPRNRARFDITSRLMEEAHISWGNVTAGGGDRIGELLWANLVGDYASYYLGMLHGVDPTPVAPIAQLKSELAAHSAAE